MNSCQLASAVFHRFALDMELVEHGFCAEDSFVKRGGIHRGLSPNHSDSVSIQRIVTAHERQILRQTLRDEHPVKGIAAMQVSPHVGFEVFQRLVEVRADFNESCQQ